MEHIKYVANSFRLVCVEMLKKTFVFRGRASLEEFSLFVFLSIILFHALDYIGEAVNITTHVNSFTYSMLCGMSFIFLAAIVLAACVRRLHDTGESGRSLCWLIIPIIGAVALFFMTIRSSQPEDNKYGSLLSQKNKSSQL
jgi:uncharacterized membrane protein YhaH (DUF805 family)